MKRLKETFEKIFGIPLPPNPPLAEAPRPAYGDAETALLFGSRSAIEDPILAQGDIERFIHTCPQGYFLIGFWGHGANSYAFYWSLIDSWRRLHFRLPYGGAYMDNEKCAGEIAAFLTAHLDFEHEAKAKAASLIAVESMWVGYYKLVMRDGRVAECAESMLGNPDFESRLGFA